jgi:hypothetical protein
MQIEDQQVNALVEQFRGFLNERADGAAAGLVVPAEPLCAGVVAPGS